MHVFNSANFVSEDEIPKLHGPKFWERHLEKHGLVNNASGCFSLLTIGHSGGYTKLAEGKFTKLNDDQNNLPFVTCNIECL